MIRWGNGGISKRETPLLRLSCGRQIPGCGFFCGRRRFDSVPDFALKPPYTIRGTVVFDVAPESRAGGGAMFAIERIFPIRERRHSLEREVRF